MAEDVERVGVARVARRQDLDRLAVLERQAQVLDAPVGAHEHGLLGELGPDRPRGVEAGGAVGKLELRVVGEDDLHSSDISYTRARGYQEPSKAASRTAAGAFSQ